MRSNQNWRLFSFLQCSQNRSISSRLRLERRRSKIRKNDATTLSQSSALLEINLYTERPISNRIITNKTKKNIQSSVFCPKEPISRHFLLCPTIYYYNLEQYSLLRRILGIWNLVNPLLRMNEAWTDECAARLQPLVDQYKNPDNTKLSQ